MLEQMRGARRSKMLTPPEVVKEVTLNGAGVVTAYLTKFPQIHSHMSSQMAVGVTKVVLDQFSSALSSGHYTTYADSIRDCTVWSTEEKTL